MKNEAVNALDRIPGPGVVTMDADSREDKPRLTFLSGAISIAVTSLTAIVGIVRDAAEAPWGVGAYAPHLAVMRYLETELQRNPIGLLCEIGLLVAPLILVVCIKNISGRLAIAAVSATESFMMIHQMIDNYGVSVRIVPKINMVLLSNALFSLLCLAILGLVLARNLFSRLFPRQP